MTRRQDRLIERRIRNADFRDAAKALDNFDFGFNKKLQKKLVFELATARFVDQRKTFSSRDRQAQARVTWLKPSASPRFIKVIK